jgi:hypothetical protein
MSTPPQAAGAEDRSAQELQSITSDISLRDVPVRTSLDARLRAKRTSLSPSGADLPVYDETAGAQALARSQHEPINKSRPEPRAGSEDSRKPDLSAVLQRNREKVIPITDYEYGPQAKDTTSTPTGLEAAPSPAKAQEPGSVGGSDISSGTGATSSPAPAGNPWTRHLSNPDAASKLLQASTSAAAEEPKKQTPAADAQANGPTHVLKPDVAPSPEPARRAFAGNGSPAVHGPREDGYDFYARSRNDAGAETGEIMGIVSPLDPPRDRLHSKPESSSDDWAIKPLSSAGSDSSVQNDALLSFEPGGEPKKLSAPNMLPPESAGADSVGQPKVFPTLPADDPRVLVRTQSMPVVEMDIERLLQATARATQFGKLALGNPSLDPHRRQTVIDAENGCSLATALQDPARSPAAVLASYRYCLDRGYIEAQDTVIPLTADLLLGRIELDQYLLQRRRITGDELRDLMRIARDEGIKLTQLLVTSGFLTQSDVEILRREQRRFAFR